jgi:hypothetical protein
MSITLKNKELSYEYAISWESNWEGIMGDFHLHKIHPLVSFLIAIYSIYIIYYTAQPEVSFPNVQERSGLS